jgi:hypothetical protein
MVLKKKNVSPTTFQNFTPDDDFFTKFNLTFATLQKYSSKKTTLNIALIQQDQRRKKIRRNEEFYNLTSSNISEIAKRTITNIKKTSYHH